MQTRTATFKSIRRPSLVEEIIESFRQDVIRGNLRPGMRLPSETELAQQLGVGRGAVREAMKTLQALGVVTIQQGDGTYVSDSPSPSLLNPLAFAILFETGTLTHLVELRSLFQVGYCELAAERATQEDWERMEQAARAYEAYASAPQRELERHTELDLSYHFAILEATHNPMVIRIGRTVEELFFASIRSTLTRAEGWEWGIDAHRNMMQAIRSGDPAVIRQAINQGLQYWAKDIQERQTPTPG